MTSMPRTIAVANTIFLSKHFIGWNPLSLFAKPIGQIRDKPEHASGPELDIHKTRRSLDQTRGTESAFSTHSILRHNAALSGPRIADPR
jgi:hypothetical protein